MKLSLHEIDDQIRDVENRIAVERIALDDAVHGCASSLREAATSPKTLLAVLGVGYTVGKILFRDKQKSQPQQGAPAKKAGVLGLLTGIAGTGGGTDEKPVGTVFIGLASATGVKVLRSLNGFDRETFKYVTSQQALDMLRRELLKPRA